MLQKLAEKSGKMQRKSINKMVSVIDISILNDGLRKLAVEKRNENGTKFDQVPPSGEIKENYRI